MKNILIEGDPMEPDSTDMIAQQAFLPIEELPPGDGWRIMTGNVTHNLWARVAYRYEIEDK